VSQLLARRTAGGWSSLNITTPHEAVTTVAQDNTQTEYRAFSPDLSVALVEPQGNTPLAPQATEKTPYLRGANGEFEPLVTAGNVPPGVKFGQIEVGGNALPGDAQFEGASSDLSHVVISSAPPLTEGIVGSLEGNGNRNLYEWFGGSLRLVSVLPNGKAASEEDMDAGLGGRGDGVRHAVSDDGSRIVWEADREALYLRDMARGETVRLDALQPGARGGSGQARFEVASSDGSRIFFTDVSRLTTDATSTSQEPDLYMCEMVEVAGKLACRLKDVTVGRNAGESANVLGGIGTGVVIGAGEDGRYAYFVANGVLANGATPGDCSGVEPEPGRVCNLYVYDAVTGDVSLVARLSGQDVSDWDTYNRGLASITAGTSPDGRYLAFMSERSLTGYDNTDVHSGQPDVEVYLYDAVSGRLTCASCDPSGARPSGVFDAAGLAVFGAGNHPGLLVDPIGRWAGHWLAGSIPGWSNVDEQSFYRSRYLSDSGRLFFDSTDGLVGHDANGREDVYEYEPSGVGGCTRAGGCVGLISSGTSSEESAFLDASENGDDVFFLTASQLVPQDVDHSLDVYDARVCAASSPCLANPAAPSVACGTADSCRAAPSSQPGVFGAPPSATFNGAGNPVPGVSKAVVKKKVLSVAQRRAAALRKCRAKPRRKRASCEARTRRLYRVGVKAQLVVRSATRKGSR
jgi:WD40-like Beta Propeller Repeat